MRRRKCVHHGVVGGAVFACLFGGMSSNSARAFEIPLDNPEWTARFDNTITYNLGLRAERLDPSIGNNPVYQASEYKFPNVGDVVTNRLDLLTEFDIQHGSDYGFRASVGLWKDFAYADRSISNNPDPSISALASLDGHYSSYTNRYYNQGAEWQDAFAFYNTELFSLPVGVKVGRFNEYWGNSLYAGQGISYAQGPVDQIKALTVPGSQTKALLMPRGQMAVKVQLSDEWSIGALYAFEWRDTRFPEGGTFLGVTDATFHGSPGLQNVNGLTGIRRGGDNEPDFGHPDFGIQARYSPLWLNGTLGFYFRQFTDTYASSIGQLDVTNPSDITYGLHYQQNERLYGISLDKVFGAVSTGLEASYRQNTALFTNAFVAVPGVPNGHAGAVGDTFNLVGNVLYGLTPTFLYDTGVLIAEVAYTHLVDVKKHHAVYGGKGYACGGRYDGCSTRDNLAATVSVDFQWLQVLPGLDIDMPTTVGFGLWGNGQTLNTNSIGNDQGTLYFTTGVNFNFRQKYKLKLAYNGFSLTSHNVNGLAAGPGNQMWNDKDWVSLTFQTSF